MTSVAFAIQASVLTAPLAPPFSTLVLCSSSSSEADKIDTSYAGSAYYPHLSWETLSYWGNGTCMHEGHVTFRARSNPPPNFCNLMAVEWKAPVRPCQCQEWTRIQENLYKTMSVEDITPGSGFKVRGHNPCCPDWCALTQWFHGNLMRNAQGNILRKGMSCARPFDLKK